MSSEKEPDNFGIVVSIIAKLAGLANKAKWGQKLIANVKARIFWRVAYVLHNKFAHNLRDFAASCRFTPPDQQNPASTEGLANACREAVCDFLNVSPERVHASIKLIGPDQDFENIYTIARSTSTNRANDAASNSRHPGAKNSDFSALLGLSDGKTIWHNRYCIFHCPDLPKISAYVCSRPDWQLVYKTSLVLPLQYTDSITRNPVIIGFLTFDSLTPEIFGRLPDIYDFQGDKVDIYRELILKYPLIQLMGLLADSLATVILAALPPVNPPSLPSQTVLLADTTTNPSNDPLPKIKSRKVGTKGQQKR